MSKRRCFENKNIVNLNDCMNDLAPIVLFVYNQPGHTEQSVNVLLSS